MTAGAARTGALASSLGRTQSPIGAGGAPGLPLPGWCAVDVGEALYRAIAHRSPHTEVQTFGGAVDFLLGAAGGVVSAAARLAGVPVSTFRGWIGGRQPKAQRAGSVVGAALAAQRRARLPRGRENRLRAPGSLSGVVFKATYLYDNSESERDVEIGVYLIDSLGDELVSAYLAGDSLDELHGIFAEGIEDSVFYEETFAPDHEHGWDITSMSGWG